MKIFILFILLSQSFHLIAQFDGKPYIVHLPITHFNSIADTVNMDTIKNSSKAEFIFARPKGFPGYKFYVTLVEDDVRPVKSWEFKMDSLNVTIQNDLGDKLPNDAVHLDTLNYTFLLPQLNIGADNIYIGLDTCAKEIALVSANYLAYQKRIHSYKYPETLTFEFQYCENNTCKSLDSSLINYTRAIKLIDSTGVKAGERPDSLSIKDVTDSSHYINHNIDVIGTYTKIPQEKIFFEHTMWRFTFTSLPLFELQLSKSAYFHQKFILTHGKMDRITHKTLRKKYEKQTFSNQQYRAEPYLIANSLKWRKRKEWLHYIVLWNENKVRYWVYFD